MPEVNVNGVPIQYPATGDTNWSDEATNFAVQTSSALGKIGLSSGTNVDVAGILDVTGATTLDSTLTVAGTTTLNGTANLNGNTNIGNATSDTTAVTGILNVDSGVLYVDPTNDRVGVNKTNPAQALDVVGNSAISGTLDVTGNVTLTANLNINGNTTIGNASGDTTTINGTAVSVPNGLNIDSNTLVIDSTNDRVGIKTASPTEALDITGNIKQSGVLFNSDGTVSAPSISFTNDSNTGLYRIGSDKIGITANGTKVGEIGSGYGGFIGNVIQIQYVELTTTGTTTNPVIPFDDTIPQNTEGHELLTLSITPKFNNSLLIIESNVFIGETTNFSNGVASAIFKDSITDAIASRFEEGFQGNSSTLGANLGHDFLEIHKVIISGSTNLATFKTRVGFPVTGGSLRWNGTTSRYGGGTMTSYMKITEVMQ
jgi:hypothetical protein